LADYRNSSNIAATWISLIQQTDRATKRTGQAQPFEVVAQKVRTLGKRLNCSDTTFPIRKYQGTHRKSALANLDPAVILPQLVEYAIKDNAANKRDALETWPIELFLDLGIPHEVLVTGLEDLFYNPQTPWTTERYRAKMAQLLTYTVSSWYQASARGGGIAFGSEENAAAMLEMMKVIVGWGGLSRNAQDEALRVRDLVDRIMW
jgi:nuclear pore complex protein Nup155